jgi:hypothetical protein
MAVLRPDAVDEVTVDEDRDVRYRLNDRDEIVYANEAWDRFAGANDGGHLVATSILRCSLWDFVSDLTTRELYRDILARVRGGCAVRFPFRCDAPALRRSMLMDVSPGPDGEVEFLTRVLSEDARPRQNLLDVCLTRSGELIRMCGWCKKVEILGVWVEVETAVTRLRLFERPILPPLTHTICVGCLADMKGLLSATDRPGPAQRDLPQSDSPRGGDSG